MKSIRKYLTLRLLTGLILLVLGCNALLYFYVYKKIVSHFDMTLKSRANDIASMTEQDSEGISVEWRKEFLPEFTDSLKPDFFQIWNEKGQVIEKSPSLRDKDLPHKTGPIDKPLIWNLVLPDGRHGRAIGIRFFPHIDEEDALLIKRPVQLELVFARSDAEIRNTSQIFLVASLIITILLSGSIVILVPRIIDSGLCPLNDLSRYTSSIDEHSLSSRYPTDNLPDELIPIATRLNELLQRIESAFAREKRLTSDIAHELKTPVAELKSLAEVTMRWPDDTEFLDYSLKSTVEIANQMDRIITQILTLNRCERNDQNVHPRSIDLVTLIREIWGKWQNRAEEKAINVEFLMPDNIRVSTDLTMLSSIINNLFSNAVEYTPEGGHIKCIIKKEKEIVLTIQNSNDSLTKEDLPHIFEYLWRKDTSRTGSLHAGLGLSLVKTFVDYLGIKMNTRLTEEGDFCISLIMPSEQFRKNNS